MTRGKLLAFCFRVKRNTGTLVAISVVTIIVLAAVTSTPGDTEVMGEPEAGDTSSATDIYGDSLPKRAVARLGTSRFRQETVGRGVAFSPDGTMLASSYSYVIHIWDASSGRERIQIRDQRMNYPERLGFSADSRLLISGYGCWDVTTGKIISDVGTGVQSFAFLDNNQSVLDTVWKSNTEAWACVRNLATGRKAELFKLGDVKEVAFSPNGKYVVAGGGYKAEGPGAPLNIREIPSGKYVRTIEGQLGGTTRLSFSNDSKIVAAASPGHIDAQVLLWDIEADKPLCRFKVPGATVQSISISPDNRLVAIGEWRAGFRGRGSLMSMWDISSGQLIRKLLGHEMGLSSVAFSRDGKTLASAGWDNIIRRWDVATGEEILVPSGHEMAVNSVAFSPDGKAVVSSSADSTIRIWDPLTGRERLKITGDENPNLDMGPTSFVRSLPFASSRRVIVRGSWSELVLWDLDAEKEIRSYPGSSTHVYAFSANGQLLASSSGNLEGHIVDVASGRKIHTLSGHRDHLTALAFSPDGTMLASGGGGDSDVQGPEDTHTLRLWDVASGELIWKFGEQNEGPVASAVFSPDGTILATTSGGVIRFWNPVTRQKLRALGKAGFGSTALAFCPSGRILAAGNGDGSIWFWLVETGQRVARYTGHRSYVTCLDFSPDGKYLVSGSADTTSLVWDVSDLTGSDSVRRHLGWLTGVLAIVLFVALCIWCLRRKLPLRRN